MRERAEFMNRKTGVVSGLGMLLGVLGTALFVLSPLLSFIFGVGAITLGIVGWATEGERRIGRAAIILGSIITVLALAFIVRALLDIPGGIEK